MNLKLTLTLALTSALVPALAATAAAETPAECAYSSALPDANRSMAAVTSAKGDVFVSQSQGFQPAVPGAQLSLGSRMMVGPRGTASISVGDTGTLDIPSDTNVEFASVNDQLCVRMISAAVDIEAFKADNAQMTVGADVLGADALAGQQIPGGLPPAAGPGSAVVGGGGIPSVAGPGLAIFGVSAAGALAAIVDEAVSDSDDQGVSPVSP